MKNNVPEILQEFEYNNFKIRTLKYNDDTWFIAKDVIECLEYTNITQAIKHCEDEKGLTKIKVLTKGGEQWFFIINESNLYLLLMHSRKPSAKPFRLWIAKKVLPEIRKTGKYEKTKEDIINNPFYQYTKRDTQIQKSKEINALNFALGGVEKIIEYNRANVLQCTGLTTKELKNLGKKLGLKSKITQSAKETARNIDEFKAKACTMALNDDVIKNNKNIKLEDLTEVDKNAIKTFQSLLDIGVKPEELNRKN